MRWTFGIAVLLVLSLMGSAQASIEYSFGNISANNVLDAAAGEAQLSVVVSDAMGGMDLTDLQALFTFLNIGPDPMSITDVYFDDGSLLAIATLIDADDGVDGDPGVDFSQPATPGELPSANSASPPFVTTSTFLADSDPAVLINGVNPGESLGILFDLNSGKTLSDVYDDLDSGVVRIGIHVQGFGSGSESYVNEPIPEPASVLIWALLVGAGVFYRRVR